MQSKDKQIAQILSEFMEWYDKPKTNLLHKEGFKYFVDRFRKVLG